MTLPKGVVSLSLVAKNQLYIEYLDEKHPTGTGVDCVDLDQRIGNHEGCFDLGGFYFSLSARDVKVVGHLLHAKLSTSGKTWWDDCVVIGITVPSFSNKLSKPTVSFHRSDNLRLGSCQNLRLVDKFLLVCDSPQDGGGHREVFLNLNQCLGHKDGDFDRHGTGFSKHAQHVELQSTTLVAHWKQHGNEVVKKSAIPLCSIVHQKGNAVRPLRLDVLSTELDFQVLHDTNYRQWLPGAANVRIVNYTQKRRWYLVAHCSTFHGVYRESMFPLSEVLGPQYHAMFCIPWFSNPEIPETARSTRIADGWLTASFDLLNNKGWLEKSVDLGRILEVDPRAGSLRLKRTGACAGCGELFYAGVLYTPYTGRSVPLDLSAVRSVRERCSLCRLVHDTIKQSSASYSSCEAWIVTSPGRNNDVNAKREVKLVVQTNISKSKPLFQLRKQQPQTQATVTEYTLLLDVGDTPETPSASQSEIVLKIPEAFKTLPENQTSKSWTDPDQQWPVIEQWLHECTASHELCRGETADLPELPSRFLEIGAHGAPTRILASGNGARGAYACLSHCWGGKNNCTLNETTKSQFSEQIPPYVLPPVFTDAIAMCKKLGIPRLWIDSLCIQQDSVKDWQQESSKMGQYYANCTVCIAATSSANSSASFQIKARPSGIRSSGTDPQSGPFTLLAYPSHLARPQSHFVQSYEKEKLAAEFPLLSRAWVFQERWLSPRTLHFCSSEVVFECAEGTSCECGGVRGGLLDDGPKLGLSVVRGTTGGADGLAKRRRDLHKMPWSELVSAYSALDLTKLGDRLVAISGLASTMHAERMTSFQEVDEVHKGLSIQYLAGLWSHSLETDLAWFVGATPLSCQAGEQKYEVMASHRTDRKSRPTEYLAPTWSWASILDPVRFLTDNVQGRKPLFELLDAHIPLATDDPFGAVTNGCSIRLRGKILSTSWAMRPGDNSGTPSLVLTEVVGTQQLDKEDASGLVFTPDFAVLSPGPYQIRPQDKLYVFPLATQQVKYLRWVREASATIDASRSTACLVLKAVYGLDEKYGAVYERVGFTEYVNFQGGVRNVDCNKYVAEDFFLV